LAKLPGFIHNINPNIYVGVGIYPYTFAWLLGFVGTTITYIPLSLLFKEKATFIERAIGPDDIYLPNRRVSNLTLADIEGVEYKPNRDDGTVYVGDYEKFSQPTKPRLIDRLL